MTGGVLRIGWDEPDWFGPARLRVPGDPPILWSAGGAGFSIGADWVHASARRSATNRSWCCGSKPGRPGTGLATGDFATPAVAWHFDPHAVATDGGAPEGMRAFGHQYTEFALPVFSDADDVAVAAAAVPAAGRACRSGSSRPTAARCCSRRCGRSTSR